MQGLLELVGLPYVGNGVLASAIGMDKHVTKTVLEGAGIQVAPWVTLTRAALAADPELWSAGARALGLPVFVKPARAGSSVGVSKVADWSELDAALDIAFAEDRTVLVESAVVGREIECGVLEGRSPGERPRQRRRRGRRHRARLLRLRGEVPRRAGRRPGLPGRPRRRRAVRAAARRAARVRGDRRRGPRARRRLPHRRGLRRQRDQHDARLHAHLDVPDVLAETPGSATPSSSTSSSRSGSRRGRRPLARGVVERRRSRPRPGWRRHGAPRGRRSPSVPDDHVVVDEHLDGGRAAVRREEVVRGVRLVDDPVDAVDAHAAVGGRARAARRRSAAAPTAGCPHAPVPCALVSRSGRPATVSGRRTTTAAQSGSLADGAASSATACAAAREREARRDGEAGGGGERRSPRRGRGATRWGIPFRLP